MADHPHDDSSDHELDAISVELHTWVDHATGHYACHAPEYELTGFGATADAAERALFDRLEDTLNAPSN